MNEQDADRIRDAIQHDQTSCRCGHLLAACADCRGWLLENSPRIAFHIEWWYIKALEMGQSPGAVWGSDAAEADDRAYYLSVR
jgi:hypothetical protein